MFKTESLDVFLLHTICDGPQHPCWASRKTCAYQQNPSQLTFVSTLLSGNKVRVATAKVLTLIVCAVYRTHPLVQTIQPRRQIQQPFLFRVTILSPSNHPDQQQPPPLSRPCPQAQIGNLRLCIHPLALSFQSSPLHTCLTGCRYAGVNVVQMTNGGCRRAPLRLCFASRHVPDDTEHIQVSISQRCTWIRM